jgi:hypothetical protein
MADRNSHVRRWFLFEFWPSRETGREAFDLAMQVRGSVLALVPPEAKP